MSAAPSPSRPSPPSPPEAGRGSGRARRWLWLGIRVAAFGGLAYLAVLVVASNSAELSGATGYLSRARWEWIAPAVVAEMLSYLAFTQLQRRLLAAGDLSTPLLGMLGITLAGNAINTSLPGGGAFATVFAYRQFRRRGADEALTTWTLVTFTALTAITLAVLAAVGLVISGSDGPVSGLWPVVVVLIIGPLIAVAVLLRPHMLGAALHPPLRWAQQVARWPRRDLAADLDLLMARLQAVKPGLMGWLAGLSWSMGTWLTDCLCLVLAFEAVGGGVPWRGVLVAYGAAQVAANVPITPGGLGIVEGSLTIALVAYGGSTEGTVAAVLLYRILSFWSPLPIGWLAWLGIQFEARRHPVIETSVLVDAPTELEVAGT